MQNKPNFRKGKMNLSSVKTMDYEQITMNNPNKYKPNQTQPVVSLPAVSKVEPSNLFQTAHLLVNRMKPLLNFHLKNSLTGRRNSLKCWFSYSERSYYEEFYSKERTGRAQLGACGRPGCYIGPNGFKNSPLPDGKDQAHIYASRRYRRFCDCDKCWQNKGYGQKS